MSDLTHLTERLAADVVLLDPADLPGLAKLHTALAQLAAAAGETAAATDLTGRATGAGRLIEQIILREVDDADAALKAVVAAVGDLQQLVTGAADGASMSGRGTQAARRDGAAPQAVSSSADLQEAPLRAEDAPLVADFVAEARGHLETAESELLKLEDNPADAEALNAIFRAFHTIKGVAGFLGLKQVAALAHAAENLLDLARKAQLAVTADVVDVVLASADQMKALVDGVEQAVQTSAAPAALPGLGELLARLEATAAGEETAGVGNQKLEASPVPARTADPTSHATGPAMVKVATDRLDALINMVGELVIAQSMVSQNMAEVARQDPRAGRNLNHLGKITRELQELSMAMRMVPIAGVFQKMNRLVRDLSRKVGKDVALVVKGEETELDRNVVEAIADPLVHMVRNAIDHGIEPPDARVKAGKPAGGRVELRAGHQAGNIVIEIADDGRGLNKARILQKASAAGLVTPGQELSDPEIFKLIFHAGLSTAEKLTDVSGRGVGMDVVRKNVEALRGRIDIASVEGRGSTFTIRLPLTLAVIDGLVVKVGAEKYILPITSIDQSLRPKAEQLSTVQESGEMCLVRGRLLPLFRLHRLFAVRGAVEDAAAGLVVIVQDGDRACGLLVDDLLGQQQVVIKSLDDGVGQVAGVSGAAILGDGNVSLILDVPGIIALATARQGSPQAGRAQR